MYRIFSIVSMEWEYVKYDRLWLVNSLYRYTKIIISSEPDILTILIFNYHVQTLSYISRSCKINLQYKTESPIKWWLRPTGRWNMTVSMAKVSEWVRKLFIDNFFGQYDRVNIYKTTTVMHILIRAPPPFRVQTSRSSCPPLVGYDPAQGPVF